MKNRIIKNIIEEAFASKAQQRFFYAQANNKKLKPKERKKWDKWAKDASSKTDFKEIPDKIEAQVDEIVDETGNFQTGKEPTNAKSKGVTSKSTTDKVVVTGKGQMGSLYSGNARTHSRYFGETDMSKALGFKDTMGRDLDREDAEQHFEDELGLSDEEAEERMAQYGYDEKLPKEKVRLVENPKRYVSDYVESILRKKNNVEDIVGSSLNEKEVSPIIKKQVKALKNTLEKNNLSINDLIALIKNDE